MIPYPEISPEIIRIGPFSVRWYGLMYLIGFAASFFLVRYQIKKIRQGARGKRQEAKAKEAHPITYSPLPLVMVDSLYSYLILGLLLGARLGYIVFYNLSYYLRHPVEIFAVWQGGMSFHGGLIGSVFAGFLFCRKFRLDFWQASDMVIVTAPIGLGLGRLGNFINGELYGRVTDIPWAMVFPGAGYLPRHPSQIYELLLEGILLFAILWTLKNRDLKTGVLTSAFIMLYGFFRFVVEFFREPDAHIGYLFGIFTMGQMLSLFMITAGLGLFNLRRKY